MDKATFQNLPPGQLRLWAQDPTTVHLLRLLSEARTMRVETILALNRASANETLARAQALHHSGAEEVLADLIDLIGTRCMELKDV